MDLAAVPVTRIKGVGPKQAEKLARIKISNIQDVLFHLPLRYQDRTREIPIGDLAVGLEAVFRGKVLETQVLLHRRRSLLCTVGDDSGVITLRFFHFNNQLRERLREGTVISCFGEVRRGRQTLEVVHPEYQVVTAGQNSLLAQTLTPIYPVTDGLHQLAMRKITDHALSYLDSTRLAELIPVDDSTITLAMALRTAHRPPPQMDTESLLSGNHPAVKRLALEELVAHRVSMQRVREVARRLSAPRIDEPGALCEALIKSLPFTLTGAQQRVIGDVAADMQSAEPMLRLIQGDVGSGKTMVAAAAAAMVVGAGYQVAIMAPTEILAEQHLASFSNCFEPLGIKIGWLKGKLGARQRRDAIESIALGQTEIVVGTHALFQPDVEFARLGLTIVDEQHRFGVHQRLSLREKGVAGNSVPHQLTMTATPIPRTLAMTAYADLDCSVIDELPPGRQEIQTVAVPASRRLEVVERVAAAIAEGRQVYWVCTLVEESEVLQARAAEDTLVELSGYMSGVNVAMVHGRMSGTEKDEIMRQFKANKVQLLVATTVIEVGVDVPNASLIIIENAERLGLSQLHQLRGRVGRGSVASSCVLVYETGLSQRARERIAIMRESNDGFAIAEKDLELRGAGELLGTRQTGAMHFRIADLMRDKHLLDQARVIADKVPSENITALVDRWMGGDAPVYGNV